MRKLAVAYQLPKDGSVNPSAFEAIIELCDRVEDILKLEKLATQSRQTKVSYFNSYEETIDDPEELEEGELRSSSSSSDSSEISDAGKVFKFQF